MKSLDRLEKAIKKEIKIADKRGDRPTALRLMNIVKRDVIEIRIHKQENEKEANNA